MTTIDLNADLGESYGVWRMGDDAGVMPWITSANVACEFHGGDPGTIQATVALCLAHGVRIGAHPSLPDLQGFGRREMKLAPTEVYAHTLYQIGALYGIVRAAGGRLDHVKPHGALYNMAARDRALADAIARAVRDFEPTLSLVGLAGSALVEAGQATGLTVLREAFCDRRYRPDGTLVPRTQPGAIIDDRAQAVAQAVSIATRGEVTGEGGASVRVEADTLCVHGDRDDAAAFAAALRSALAAAEVTVVAVAPPA